MKAVVRSVLVLLLLALVAIPASAQTPPVRQITIDDAVRMALENNLGIRVARIDPQIGDLSVALARAGWAPALTSTVQQASTEAPADSFLSGGATGITQGRFASNVSLAQATPWGGRYSIGWDTSRQTTNNSFSNFSPRVSSSLSLSLDQPLFRNYRIDSLRQQLINSRTNREIDDITVLQTVTATARNVRTAYWDLAFAIASLQVQQQSLDLAQESLRNTRSRVEIGTTPPIDVVEAEAEVATRQEAVIVAQSQIETSMDALRALIYDPAAADYWTVRIMPSQLPAFQPMNVDVDAAVRNALQRRTDLQQARKNLSVTDVNVRFFRNQTLPDVTASFDYGLTGLGGTQLVRGPGFPGEIIGRSSVGFGSVLGDLFGNQFPSWTLGVNINYPVGNTAQQASFARARLEYTQAQTRIRSQELQVTTQVRNAARQVTTNQQRIQTTRASREASERRLDAEQRKLAAGTSTSFLVFQAQRDLAQARNNELRAVLDFNRSLVDLETVQEAPLAGAAAAP